LKQFFRHIVTCLVVLESFTGTAQSISGKVFSNQRPLEFANVVIRKAADTTKIVNAIFTDSLGNFYVKQIPFDKYILKISLVGYRTYKGDFVIEASRPDVSFNEIELTEDVTYLKAVEVSAQKQTITKTPGGFIVHAKDNISQASGTATDLLRNTPTVVVDEEGAITIRGKSPLILVNGRNSILSSTDRIPASSVESIEIINNPSAKYDADADGGIINITLKKNKSNGTNGSMAVGGGYGASGRFNSAFVINHQKGKWNVAMAYDNRFANRTRKAEAERIDFNSTTQHDLLQNRHDLRFEQTQNLKFNADYNMDKNNVFNFELIGNLNGEDNHETLVSRFNNDSGQFVSQNSRYSAEFLRERAIESAMNYNHKFADKRKNLSVSLSTAFNFDRENTDISTQSLDENSSAIDDPYLQRTHNYQNLNISNFRFDYTQPVGERATIETGYKLIFRKTDTDYQNAYFKDTDYVVNPNASNMFHFAEQIHAAYFIYKNSVGPKDAPKLKYDIGIRGEPAFNSGKSGDKTLFTNKYFNYYPSLNVAYYTNATNFLRLTFGRRINRPTLEQLNPFVDITDSLNTHGGNPYLKPELINSTEFGYSMEWKNMSSVSNLFYRYSTNIIRPYISLNPDGVALTVPMNFGSAIVYGFEEIFSVQATKFYTLNTAVSLFQQIINGSNVSSDAVNNYFSWYAKAINNFGLWRGGKLQLIGNYNSPIATPQGTRIAVYNVDGGFQQKLFKNRGAIGLVVTDIFNTQYSGLTANTSDFYYHRKFKVDTRAFLLTFTYSFRTLAKEELLENKFSND
jgi:outer membrane receptor protein involved in Fe transport